MIRCRCGIDEADCMRQQQREQTSEPCDDRLAARYAELGITLCPDCEEPTHASESDDTGRCAKCRPRVTHRTRAGRSGRAIFCPHCHQAALVFHFAWSALVCGSCKAEVEKLDWHAQPIGGAS